MFLDDRSRNCGSVGCSSESSSLDSGVGEIDVRLPKEVVEFLLIRFMLLLRLNVLLVQNLTDTAERSSLCSCVWAFDDGVHLLVDLDK
jgi:hypothetical protein